MRGVFDPSTLHSPKSRHSPLCELRWAQRNDLITQLEVQLQQQVVEHTLFTIEWELI